MECLYVQGTPKKEKNNTIASFRGHISTLQKSTVSKQEGYFIKASSGGVLTTTLDVK